MSTFAPPKTRPVGDWKACPACGMAGTTTRVARWLGSVPEHETRTCRRCDGAGWLPAPPWYAQPVKQWPAGEAL